MGTSDTRVNPGTMFEYRLARLRYVQGTFVRRSIDVWPQNSSENRQLAELDCISVSFDPQLRKSIEIVECKTASRGSKESDRVLWLLGVRNLTQADTVTLAKLSVSRQTRELARQLDVSVLDLPSIDEAERELGIPDNWWPGFHNPELGEGTVKQARKDLNADSSLLRAGRFLYGSYWFADDFTRVKQLRRLFRLLVDREYDIQDKTYQLGIAEATVLVTMTAISIGAWRGQLSEDEFRVLVAEELATGLGDPRSLRSLLRRIDDLNRTQIEAIHQMYESASGNRIAVVVPSFESQLLVAPEWTDAFADLALRLWRRSHAATDLLRWMDLWAARLMGADSNSDYEASLFRSTEQDLQTASNLVVTFLKRFWNVPEDAFVNMIPGTETTTQTPVQLSIEVSPPPNDMAKDNGIGGSGTQTEL